MVSLYNVLIIAVDIINAVKDKSADCGLIFDIPYVSEELVALPLRQEQLFVVMHPEHHLALETAVTPAQLHQEPLILTEETCTYRKYLLEQLNLSGITPIVDMEFGNLEGIKEAVKHRWGTAFLPGYAIVEESRAGAIKGIPLAGNQGQFYIQLIYRKDRWVSSAFGTFIEQMKE